MQQPIGGLGVAGGEKFLVQGILFKYAVDVVIGYTNDGRKRWMYGGLDGPDDYAAMKAAGNELLSMAHLFKLNINQLHFPLAAIIDYVGYRLMAVSTLPISENTIVYAFVITALLSSIQTTKTVAAGMEAQMLDVLFIMTMKM